MQITKTEVSSSCHLQLFYLRTSCCGITCISSLKSKIFPEHFCLGNQAISLGKINIIPLYFPDTCWLYQCLYSILSSCVKSNFKMLAFCCSGQMILCQYLDLFNLTGSVGLNTIHDMSLLVFFIFKDLNNFLLWGLFTSATCKNL